MNAQVRWQRPATERSGPDRGAGGFYRTADDPTMTLGGVPLNETEDAVVAAVRLAYRVADAQIQRSSRLAARLRSAGDRALGPRSDRQALDATERLVFNAAMSGLGWLEGVAAEGDSPIKRLVAVQYRLLGAMLGVTGDEGYRDAARGSTPASADAAGSRPPQPEAAATRRSASAWSGPSASLPVHVVLSSNGDRAVTVLGWDTSASPIRAALLTFYHAQHAMPADAARPKGTFDCDDTSAILHIRVPAEARPGRWRAAICDAARNQVGWMEIEV